MVIAQAPTAPIFTMVLLFFILICVSAVVVVASLRSPQFAGFAKTFLVVAVLGIALLGVVFLLAAPVIYYSRSSSRSAYEDARVASAASEAAWGEEAAARPSLRMGETDDIAIDIAAPETVPSPPTPSRITRRGEIVYAGSGDEGSWSHDFANKHVADLYSSDVEATKSLARQCAARISSYKKDHHGASRPIRFETGDWPPSIVDAFMQTFRAHCSLPLSDIPSSNPVAAVELRMSERVNESEKNGVKTYVVPLKFPHDNEGANAEIVLTAKFVDAPWVTNSVAFRTSESAPERYLIAAGGNDGDEPMAPIEQARQCIEPLLERRLNGLQFVVGASTASLGLNTDVARRLTEELIKEQFVQNFTTTVEGQPIGQVVSFEAYLLDTSEGCIKAAIDKVALEQSAKSGLIAAGHRTSSSNRSELPLFQFGMVLLVTCGVLKGVSWAYDRERA